MQRTGHHRDLPPSSPALCQHPHCPSILPVLPSPIPTPPAPSQHPPALSRCARCPQALHPRSLPAYPIPPGTPSPVPVSHSPPGSSRCVPVPPAPSQRVSASPFHPNPIPLCPHSHPSLSHRILVSPFPSQSLSRRVFTSPRPSSPIPAFLSLRASVPVPKVSQRPPAPSLRRYPPPWLNRPARPPPIRARTPRNHAPLREHVTWCPPRGASGPIGGAALPQLSAHPRVTVSPR